MAGQVACSITFRLDNKRYDILIDTVEETEISLSSTITTHPVANGDLIGDHMYKEPLSLSIKGNFGMNGGSSFQLNNRKPTFTEIQRLFERVKNEAILCELTKISMYGNVPYSRFLNRRNLVLSQISWSEGINALGFNFTFTEVMITKYVSYDVDNSDRFLPNVELAERRAFSETLLNWTQLYAEIIRVCKDEGLITEEFLNYASKNFENYALGIGLAAGGVSAVALGILLASNPVGWVIGGTAAIAAGLYFMINGIVKLVQKKKALKKYKIKQFELSKDDAKNQKEIERFSDFTSEIYKIVVALVNGISVWYFNFYDDKEGIGKDYQVAANLLNEYFVFDFHCYGMRYREVEGAPRTSTRQWRIDHGYEQEIWDYRVTVTDMNGAIKGTCSTASSATDFSQCMSNNCIFRLPVTGEYVYILQKLNLETNMIDNAEYYIVASRIKPEDFWNSLDKAIEQAFLN